MNKYRIINIRIINLKGFTFKILRRFNNFSKFKMKLFIVDQILSMLEKSVQVSGNKLILFDIKPHAYFRVTMHVFLFESGIPDLLFTGVRYTGLIKSLETPS
jgi:hypothetical protein